MVEFGDEFAGGGEHDRVESVGAVGGPGGEQVVGHGGFVADVDAVVVEVEAECFGEPVAQGEGGGAFGLVGKSDEFGEPQRAVFGFDVAKDAAGLDRGELLVVADEADAGAFGQDVADHGVEGEGSGHPGFVDDDQALASEGFEPAGMVVVFEGPDELGEGVGVGADLVAEGGCGGRGRCEAEDGSAGVGPRFGEGVHGGGLARACGCDGELDACAGGRHLADEHCLAGVERHPVRFGLQDRQVNRGARDAPPVSPSGGCEQALLGGEDSFRGVLL